MMQVDNVLKSTPVGLGQTLSIRGPVRKVGSVFAGLAAEYGGQESRILSFRVRPMRRGFVIVGLP